MQKAFFGDANEPLTPALSPSDGVRETAAHGGHHPAMENISIPERIGAVILIGASLLIGLYPRLLLDVIIPSFDSPLFDWMRKGGGQ